MDKAGAFIGPMLYYSTKLKKNNVYTQHKNTKTTSCCITLITNVHQVRNKKIDHAINILSMAVNGSTCN